MVMVFGPLGEYAWVGNRVYPSEVAVCVFADTDIVFGVPLASVSQDDLTAVPAGNVSIGDRQSAPETVGVVTSQWFPHHP